MASSVTVHGADKASANLTGMAGRAAEQGPMLALEAQRTARRISGIPVRTGALEYSVRTGGDADSQGFVVRSNVRYARFVFGGTRYMAARPPQVPGNLGAEVAQASLGWITR